MGFVWRSVSGSTINSAGGDSVAPDLVPSGDVCLGGSCCGERMGYHGVCHSFKYN